MSIQNIKLSKYFFVLLLSTIFIQCQSNSSPEAADNLAMHWQEKDQKIVPLKTEGSFLQFSNYCQIVLAGRGDGNEGLLILLIAKENEIVQSHYLSNNRQKMGIPYEKMSIKQNVLNQGMLEVYISEACRPSSGKVVVTEYDPEEHLLSGYFEAKLCTTGKLGRLDEKRIQHGVFNKVKLNYFDRRKPAD